MSKKMKRDNYFFCYSSRLAEHLINNGEEFITRAKAVNSNKTFYLFEQSDRITQLVKEYNRQRELMAS